jgi:hypothetical protein
MSGGHFDYIQYRMENVADQIRREITRHDFPAEINARFEQAAQATELAAKMVQRVDWLLSDDDGEDSFMSRWNAEIKP